MVDGGSEFIFFWGIHVRIDVRIDISISIRPKNPKFGRQIHLQELNQMTVFQQVLVTLLRQYHGTNLKHISTTKVLLGTKFGSTVTYLDCLLPIKSPDPLITFPYILKLLYLHYHDAYCNQAWQGCNLSWGDPIHKVIWQFNHVTS